MVGVSWGKVRLILQFEDETEKQIFGGSEDSHFLCMVGYLESLSLNTGDFRAFPMKMELAIVGWEWRKEGPEIKIEPKQLPAAALNGTISEKQ